MFIHLDGLCECDFVTSAGSITVTEKIKDEKIKSNNVIFMTLLSTSKINPHPVYFLSNFRFSFIYSFTHFAQSVQKQQ